MPLAIFNKMDVREIGLRSLIKSNDLSIYGIRKSTQSIRSTPSSMGMSYYRSTIYGNRKMLTAVDMPFATIAHWRNVRALGRVSYIDYIENLNMKTEMLMNEKLPDQV